MQATPRRDPKKFAQRTMAAAITASAMATFGVGAFAQTTGGGIGAAVDSNAGPPSVPTQGTSGTAGGTTNSGVAAPNAPANPLRPGTGPGINNTGSPVLPTPRNLQAPIGGASGGPRGPNGTTRIPGNTTPGGADGVTPRTTNGVNGANVPQPITPGSRATQIPAPRLGGNTPPTNTGAAAPQNRRPGANLRTGTLMNFNDRSISFREGANTSTLNVNADTVIQMDGRNVTLRDIPANAQIRVERSASNPNLVQRIVVVPQAVGNSLPAQTGTGSTGIANRSLPNNDLNAATPNASTPNNDINAGTANASTPNNDLNAGTANASTPGNDVNAPVVNNPNTSNRPLAPGQNPADQPVAPFTRGADQRLQAGFNEPATQNDNAAARQTPPVSGNTQIPVPNQIGVGTPRNVNSTPSTDTGRNAPVVLPQNGGVVPNGAPPQASPRDRAPDQLFTTQFGERFGMQMNVAQNGLTIGNVNQQSIAARSGLRQGDLIQSVNGQTISSPVDFGRALRAAQGQPVTATVLRNGNAENVSLSLPNDFFNGLQFPAAVTTDGVAGANVNGVFVPATGDVNVGATPTAGAAATATATTGPQAVAQQGAAVRGRPLDPPVGTQRTPVTTEALKVPDVDLGWTLKATPEGVVMSSLVDDGLAAKNQLEIGDIIETIDGRPVTSPGAVSYELHRHRAGATVDLGILRKGQRMTEQVTLPQSHKPLLLNRNETFGQANNDAKEQGGSGARPVPLTPTEESIRTLEAENRALRKELEELRRKP